MDYQNINTERQFKDATGYGKSDFKSLLDDYENAYLEEHGQTYESYIEESVIELPKLKSLGDALFFVLFQLKNDLIWGSLGCIFGMAVSSAHDNFVYFSDLLELTLKKKALPKRRFESVKEFESYVASAKELIFDGTENLTERPQGYDNQKDKYSGKKHSHTDIALVLSDKATKIYYVSKLYNGSQVDMGLLKKEFPPGLGWFKNFKLLVDLGFIGIDKLYKIKTLVIGEKRPRKSKANPKRELSKEQKDRNTEVSRERIFVEHAIGRMKKYRILKNRCRLKCQELKNRIIGICAGLSNYQLALSC